MLKLLLQELDRATEVINDYLTFAKPTLDTNETINISKEIQICCECYYALS